MESTDGASGIAAVLDTSVLFPISLCGLLPRSAERRLYLPQWTQEILKELGRNLETRIGTAATRRRIEDMVHAFPNALVVGHRPLIGAMANHPKDRHVVAAAVTGRAATIVTANLKDFPAASLDPFRIRAVTPDDFLCALLDAAPAAMAAIVREQAADLRRPPVTREELLRMLGKHAPGFAARVAQFSG